MKYAKIQYAMLVFTVICFSSVSLFSQGKFHNSEDEQIALLKSQPLNGFFGLSFTNAVPQGAFQENIRKTGLGFSLYGGMQLDELPLGFGIEGDILFFGGEDKIYKYKRTGGWELYGDTVSTSSVVVPLNVFFRLQPNQGFILPYFEGFAGITFLSTSANYKPAWGPKDSKDKFSVAFNYGFGVGFMVKLVDFINLPDEYSTLNLDIKMRYLIGTETKYYTVKLEDDSTPVFTEYNSKTDKIMTMIGIAFRF